MTQANKELVNEFPFLKYDDDYEYTWLDDLEDGWRECFGIQLCADLKDCLEESDFLEDYRISQIKEKWGQLRWYDNFGGDKWLEHLYAWTYISEHTCKNCGKFPVPMRDDGWVSPYCDRCYKDLSWSLRKGKKTIEELTCEDPFNGRLLEYLHYREYDNGKYNDIYVDMKPYYKKIGYDSDNLISKEEYHQYENYLLAAKEYEEKYGKIKDPCILPYEIQHMNPFKKD